MSTHPPTIGPFDPPAPLRSDGSARTGDFELSTLGRRALAVLAARWRVVLLAGLVASVAVIGGTLLQPRSYTSSASFVLQGGRINSPITGLASQFGIPVPVTSPSYSLAFYQELVHSRAVLESVAVATVCDPCEGGNRLALSSMLERDGGSPQRTLAATTRYLQKAVAAEAAQQSGIVRINVTMPSAQVAEQVANLVLAQVSRVNSETRRDQAGAERRFTEQSLGEVAADLRSAEQRLKAFRESNRFIVVPELQLQESRLEREVRRYEEIYMALVRAYEQARIDEVRDTPTLAILDTPSVPVEPNSRGLLTRSVFAFLVGSTLAAALLIWAARRSLGLVRS
ncbi:MAG: hypothetical protein ACT4R6_00720 [Gemmatimonadaceae bacterium]